MAASMAANSGAPRSSRVDEFRGCDDEELPPSWASTYSTSKAIRLVDFPNLIALPESMGELRAIKALYLDNMGLRALPDSIGELTGLHTLSITRCPHLGRIPGSITAIAALQFLICSGEATELEVSPAWDLQLLDLSALPKLRMVLCAGPVSARVLRVNCGHAVEKVLQGGEGEVMVFAGTAFPETLVLELVHVETAHFGFPSEGGLSRWIGRMEKLELLDISGARCVEDYTSCASLRLKEVKLHYAWPEHDWGRLYSAVTHLVGMGCQPALKQECRRIITEKCRAALQVSEASYNEFSDFRTRASAIHACSSSSLRKLGMIINQESELSFLLEMPVWVCGLLRRSSRRMRRH